MKYQLLKSLPLAKNQENEPDEIYDVKKINYNLTLSFLLVVWDQ